MRPIDAEPIEQTLFRQADKALAKDPYANARVCAFRWALELIIDAPTIAPPPNDPLTLAELREMALRCEGVYIAHTDGSPVFRNQTYCAAVLDFRPAFGSTAMHIQAIYGDRLTMWEDEYGKTWIAYRRRPEGAS